MLKAGRCEHPTVVFVKGRDGELVGRLPTSGDPSPDRIAEESVFLVRIATRLFGDAALSGLIGISVASLPAYRNGNRTLPPDKATTLRVAIRRGAGLLVG